MADIEITSRFTKLVSDVETLAGLLAEFDRASLTLVSLTPELIEIVDDGGRFIRATGIGLGPLPATGDPITAFGAMFGAVLGGTATGQLTSLIVGDATASAFEIRFSATELVVGISGLSVTVNGFFPADADELGAVIAQVVLAVTDPELVDFTAFSGIELSGGRLSVGALTLAEFALDDTSMTLTALGYVVRATGKFSGNVAEVLAVFLGGVATDLEFDTLTVETASGAPVLAIDDFDGFDGLALVSALIAGSPIGEVLLGSVTDDRFVSEVALPLPLHFIGNGGADEVRLADNGGSDTVEHESFLPGQATYALGAGDADSLVFTTFEAAIPAPGMAAYTIGLEGEDFVIRRAGEPGSGSVRLVDQLVTSNVEVLQFGGDVIDLVGEMGGADGETVNRSDASVSVVFDGLDGGDTLTGGSGLDILKGSAGNDVIAGGGGNDLLIGGADDDMLAGGDGDDDLNGGEGFDALLGGAANDTLDGGTNPLLQGDILLGGEGDDTYVVDSGLDLVDEGFLFADAGFGGHDTILSKSDFFWDIYGVGETLAVSRDAPGLATIIGGVNDNTFAGHAGSDIVFGRGGSDVFRTGDGTDWISLSLLGVDAAWRGANTIIVDPRASGGYSFDIVFDFTPGRDVIDVSAYGYAAGTDVRDFGHDDGAGNSYYLLGDGLDYVFLAGVEVAALSASDFRVV